MSIAFLEETYLPQAKRLALDELARRGFREVNPEMIERVRELRREEREDQIQSFESEGEMPPWRLSVRKKLSPYRPIFVAFTIAVAVLTWLVAFYGVDVLGRTGRGVLAISGILVLIGMGFFAPTREEMRKKYDEEDSR